jgi:hypothetical protein
MHVQKYHNETPCTINLLIKNKVYREKKKIVHTQWLNTNKYMHIKEDKWW